MEDVCLILAGIWIVITTVNVVKLQKRVAAIESHLEDVKDCLWPPELRREEANE
jgi:hypothetical protein